MENGLPNGDDFLFASIQYLMFKDTEEDKNLALLLSAAELNFVDSPAYSRVRWNHYQAFANLRVSISNLGLFTDEIKSNIYKVFDYLFPDNLEYDLMGIEVIPRIEQAYEGWKEDLFRHVSNEDVNNQATFEFKGKPIFEYNQMKFRSQSEKRLAPEFEKRKDILFFPLPVANCAGKKYEPDFLVCKKGKWAILEVISDQYHPSVEKEAHRTNWFQNHNIQVRQYPAKACYQNAEGVVEDL